MITGINSEDSLVQRTFAEHLEEKLGWENVYAWNQETFGLAGTRAAPTPAKSSSPAT
jgi:type I restriction enzyme R subunit